MRNNFWKQRVRVTFGSQPTPISEEFLSMTVLRGDDYANEVADALRKEFGYAPQENDGEKWVIYRDCMLIVAHPERRPRIYRRGGSGVHDYTEIDPLF